MKLCALLFLVAMAIAGWATDVPFVVINSTESPITGIQVRQAGGPFQWSEDMLLNGRALPPGAGDPYLRIDDNQAALWDVKLTTEDGGFTFFSINLSKTPILTLTHFLESGLWILALERTGQRLPDLDESDDAKWPDLWSDEELQEPQEAPEDAPGEVP